jgi:hypothetical protein
MSDPSGGSTETNRQANAVASHAAAAQRRKEGRARHVRTYLVEERFEAEVNPGRRRGIMVRWQETTGLFG